MSAALRESGTLLVGVEINGVVHRDFVLRPRLVRDSIAVLEDARAQSNDAYRGVALIACQIERLGDLLPEQINTELLMGMLDADLSIIMEANGRLEVRLNNFRAESQVAAYAASGAT